MSQGDLGLVVVGAGWAGDRHACAIQEQPGVRLAAVVDPDHDAARELVGRYGDSSTLVHPRLAAALSEDVVDAGADSTDRVAGVIICSPTALHAGQAQLVLERGVACLVEKPFAATLGDAHELVDLSERTKTPLMAAQILRFLPMFTWAADVIDSGRLGRPVQVIERRLEDRDIAHDWWRDMPAFLVTHWGSHTIDLVSHLFDTGLGEVHCRATSARHAGVVDDFTAQVQFDSGLVMTSSMSLASRRQVHDLVIIGTKATLSFDCYRTAQLDGRLVMEMADDEMLAAGFSSQLAAFADAVRTRRVEAGTARSALRSLEVIHAAEQTALAAGVRLLSETS